jgi:hypothetical protein
MEEKKEQTVNTTENQRPEKMSYEQLENIAHQLSEQAKQLYAKLQEANMTNAFKRLDYLFKVVECRDIFSPEFYIKCVEEIESFMTIPEEEDKEN